jgi:hypothetical protein
MIWVTTNWNQAGSSRSFAESFSLSNGLPVYFDNPDWKAPTAAEFFANRDPRLRMVLRPRYHIQGEPLFGGFVNFSNSGLSCGKFADDANFTGRDAFAQGRNITGAPSLRFGEVLINYAEIMYELGVFNQAVADNTINRLRSRSGVNMPRLVLEGNMPSVGGVVYDDPMRLKLNPANDVSPILWEIRRERRVELGHEGFRTNDLRRWKKLDYMFNSVNPDIRFGAYIRLADYPNRNQETVVLEDSGATEGYILGNRGNQRQGLPLARNYIFPVPNNQIVLYSNRGYKLEQTAEWRD